jgi:hypothetical protein
MRACFQEQLLNQDDPTFCQDAQDYRGNLSSLRSAKLQCDQIVRTCQQVSPTCFLNMTLSWEQGLLAEQERLNESVTQLLLQRSGRAHEEGFDNYDDDHNGGIDATEFRKFLNSTGYQLSNNTVDTWFGKQDKSGDGLLNAEEWNDMQARLPTFCPCQLENAGVVSLILDSKVENLGLEHDLDGAMNKKKCR